ncbi:hypothetical protein [Nocardia mangyaensis]|uniref:hypothetical protein n=1 Tax=Nocardia mangyaensis TaxID=2213200 RepID=UPI002677613D|nr:hypothetical protein [Nocardia mangyaensis]MDO3647297.1 hypothetical protein [Nocardia mangyaensis]
MELKPVAMYREMYEGTHDELPSVHDAPTGTVEDDREQILDYMRKVRAIFDVMGSSNHLFVEGADIEGGPSLYSDGVWIWREDSLEYLAEQPIPLPAEFVERVRSFDYTPQSFDTRDPDFDATFLSYF